MHCVHRCQSYVHHGYNLKKPSCFELFEVKYPVIARLIALLAEFVFTTIALMAFCVILLVLLTGAQPGLFAPENLGISIVQVLFSAPIVLIRWYDFGTLSLAPHGVTAFVVSLFCHVCTYLLWCNVLYKLCKLHKVIRLIVLACLAAALFYCIATCCGLGYAYCGSSNDLPSYPRDPNL